MDQQSGDWNEARVIEVIRALAGEEELPAHLVTAEIKSTDTVETLGIDSIGAVALIDRLEEQVGVALPDDFLDFTDDVATIAGRLNGLA